MPRLSIRSTFEHVLVIAVGVAILWKGGKGLEVTWLLPFLPLLGALSLWVNSKKNGTSAVAWPAWITASLFIAWSVTSFLLSETRNYGLDEVIRDISLTLLWVQMLRMASTSREALVQRIIDAIVYSVICAAVIGLVIYICQPVGRFVGTFFDPRYHTDYWPNAWAELLLLAWPLTLWKAWQSEGRNRWVWFGVLGLLLGSLFLSFSRGAFLAMIGQVIILAGILWWLVPKKRHDVRSVILATVTVLSVAVIAFGIGNGLRSFVFPVQDLGAKVTFTADEGTSSIDERASFWDQALSFAAEKPLFGHGPYSFRFLQPRLQDAVYATSDHPHNVWLKLAMERGWPAAILWSALILISLGAAAVRVRKEREVTWVPLAAIGVVGVLAHLVIDFNLQFVGIALPFWLLLGLMAAPLLAKKAPEKANLGQSAVELLVVLLLVCVTVREGVYLMSSSLGRRAEARGDTAAALQWYEASDGSWFPRDLRLSQAAIALNAGRLPAASGAIATYLTENDQDARAYSLRAAIREAAGDRGEAAADLGQAFAWSKLNDLDVLRRWIALSRLDKTLPTVPAKEVQEVLLAFERAFMQNSHFVLLGDNVEDFIAICALADAADKEGVRAFCRDHLDAIVLETARVRGELESRQPGRLW
ncbi:MAG: O-antigen ligase family protein [Candidatus Peribacteraceae bacterium]|nr:O-antigen ligase family protein [Candidatus Peribacteraceae bacterium]